MALEGDTPGDLAGQFAPYLRFTVGGAAPALRVSSLVRSGNQLTLQWAGGTGPFTVQQKGDLSAGPWTNVVTGVTGTSATVNIEGATGFLRVQGQ